MKWYAAHVILEIATDLPSEQPIHAWENVYLVSAEDGATAKLAALERARQSAQGSFEWEGRTARWVIAGVRKIIECENEDQRPDHGTEITYTQFRFDDRSALERFVAYEAVMVLYEE